MKYIGLKFILGSGNFIQVIIPEDDAKNIVMQWMNGQLEQASVSGIIGNVNASSPYGSGMWCLKVSAIEAIHSFDLEELQRQMQGSRPALGEPWRKSGLG